MVLDFMLTTENMTDKQKVVLFLSMVYLLDSFFLNDARFLI